MTFEKELEQLINCHSKENESNTPDFILAQYLSACLIAFNMAVQQRETLYGRDARPSDKKEHRVEPYEPYPAKRDRNSDKP